jgi:hypothetical protein
MSNPMSKEEAAEFAKNFRSDDDDIQEYARPCPNCEYHRKRAQLWRDEAYKQAGHPLPDREQEPVAWGVFEGNLHDMFFTEAEAVEMARLKGTYAEVKPLYTAPIEGKNEQI